MTTLYPPSVFRVYIGFTGGGPMAVAPTWTDVSTYFMSINTTRGRSSELDDFQAGTCTVVFNNRDRRFDPTHASGPYFGNLEPRRQIKIETVVGVTTYPVFRGVISSYRQTWSHDDGQTCTVEAVDISSILAATPVAAVAGAESVSERITTVMGTTDLPVGMLDVGDASTQVGPSPEGYAWPIASLSAASEMGRLFVGNDGLVYYQPPTDDFGATASVTFADDATAGAIRYSGYELTLDERWIINACDVTGIDVAGSSSDATSITTYGGARRQVSTLLVTESACDGFAETIVDRYKTPQVRGSDWTVDPVDDTQLTAVLGVELGAVVAVKRTPRVGSAHTSTVTITAVSMSVDTAAASFRFTGSPVDTTSFFVWGTSNWGGSDGWR